MASPTHWLDRLTATVAPRWTFKRQRARIASQQFARHYDAASQGRRTQNWRKSSGDANAVNGPALSSLRAVGRDLVRNNPYASGGLDTIVDHTVGMGIVPEHPNAKAIELWRRWFDTVACDADGRSIGAGLQGLVLRGTAEGGEMLVRRRFRQIGDVDALGRPLPIPLQIQVLEPDYLDTFKDEDLPGGGRIVQGVEYDALGRRVAYWLFKEHPGSLRTAGWSSSRIPASEILHIFPMKRAGQVRGPSWFAPTELRLKEFDEVEDAVLVKQKIAACLAVFEVDPDGNADDKVGNQNPNDADTEDTLTPGLTKRVSPGYDIKVVEPPSTDDYPEFTKVVLRAIAKGLGLTYEDFTGDYGDLPFSAARMSRLNHWARVDDWRWNMLVPQFCLPVWIWAMQAGAIMGVVPPDLEDPEWTASPMPLLDPVNEGLAYQRNIRTGIQTLPEALRERGYNPERVMRQMATFNKLVDELKLILDSDPRKTTQAGQLQGTAAAATSETTDPAAERAKQAWPRR